MSTLANRPGQLWRDWQDRETEIEKLLPGQTDAAELRKQEYLFLTQGIYRISLPISPHEQFSLNMVRAIRNTLQRQLYPNPTLRFFQRLKERLIDRPIYQKRYRDNLLISLDKLEATLEPLGFKGLRSRLEQAMSIGSDTLTVRAILTSSLDRQYSTELHLSQTGPGSYRFDGYVASRETEGVKAVSMNVDADSRISVGQSFNLLDGRPVCISDEHSFLATGSWYRVAANGFDSYLTEISLTPGFELQAAAKNLGERIGWPDLADLQVLESLKRGDSVSISNRQGERYLVEADPAREGIIIRKPSGEKVDTSKLAAIYKKQQGDSQSQLRHKPINLNAENEVKTSLRVH